MGQHWCNQVIDPATCCPVAHGANESKCSCSNFFRIGQALPGATAEGYFTEIIRWTKQKVRSQQEWTWESVFIKWDAYQIGQMWHEFKPE